MRVATGLRSPLGQNWPSSPSCHGHLGESADHAPGGVCELWASVPAAPWTLVLSPAGEWEEVGLGPPASPSTAIIGLPRPHSHAALAPPLEQCPAGDLRLKCRTLCPQPEDAPGGSSPSGTSKSDANRASSGGGGGGLMEEMNKLLAKR